VWSLTPRGLETTAVDPSEVVRAVHALAAEREQRPTTPVEDDADEVEEETTAEVSRTWRDALLERLLAMQPSSFERLCMRLLRESGFIQVENVGPSVVRDFRGAMMGRVEKGLIITTGGLTRDARLEATRDGATAIDLIDGQLLVEKLKELGLGVRTKTVETVELDETWFASVEAPA
jgi:restriction system protein